MVSVEEKLDASEKMSFQGKKVRVRSLELIRHLVASNSLIMERIFGYLKFKDLKSARLACTMWEEWSQLIYENKSKIVVSILKRRPELFHEDFKTSPLTIDTFELHNSESCPSLFMRIMESQICLLSSLILNNVTICDDGGETLKEFDLSSLMAERLKTVVINSSVTTQMILCQKNLNSVKYLKLNGCKLIVGSRFERIAPWEIHMTNVSFVLDHKNGQEVNNSLLCPPNFIDCKQVSLFNVKKADGFVYSVTSQWDEFSNPCGSLNISNYNFTYALLTKSTPLENLTHLSIKGHVFEFDWSYLPNTLETLVLNNVRTTLPNPDLGFLPKLKVLKCIFDEDIPWISHFSSHTTLIKVQLKKLKLNYTNRSHFSLNWLPESVKELHLDNINLDNVAEHGFERKLKSLTLVRYKLKKIAPIIKSLKTKNLSVTSTFSIKSEDLLSVFKILNVPVKYLTIGDFKWEDESDFIYSSLADSVDKMSKYYTFKNGIGRAVQDPRIEW